MPTAGCFTVCSWPMRILSWHMLDLHQCSFRVEGLEEFRHVLGTGRVILGWGKTGPCIQMSIDRAVRPLLIYPAKILWSCLRLSHSMIITLRCITIWFSADSSLSLNISAQCSHHLLQKSSFAIFQTTCYVIGLLRPIYLPSIRHKSWETYSQICCQLRSIRSNHLSFIL